MLIITNHQRNETQNHMSHHLTPVRMDINQKTRNNVLTRMWKKGTLSLLLGMQVYQCLWEAVLRFNKL